MKKFFALAALSLLLISPVKSQVAESTATPSNSSVQNFTNINKADSNNLSTLKNSISSTPKSSQEFEGYKLVGSGLQDNLTAPKSIENQKNKFQDFVFSSTGKNLSLYGFSFFNSNRYTSSVNLPVSPKYIIGTGDEIDIKIWGNFDLALRLTVDRDGQITIPKIGILVVAGVEYGKLESVIKNHVNNIFKGVEINATLGKTKSLKIYTVGESLKPGSHVIPGFSSLISAIFETGGPSQLGSLRNINLIRDGKIISTIDIYDFIKNGSASADISLRNEDVIQFPSAGARVAILGAFDKSAIYELKSKNESLTDLINYAGGLGILSSPHKLLVERLNPLSTSHSRLIQEIDYTKNINRNYSLNNGDIITILSIGNEFSNAITLRGNVAAPLRYEFKKGMRVSDLIPNTKMLITSEYYTNKNMLVQFDSGANISQDRVVSETKNLLEEINWDYAVIQRMDYINLKTNLITFNLKKAIVDKNPKDNIELLSGDIITIFGVKDMPIPISKITHYVKISGEVNVPGLYQIEAGKTLEDLLSLAGGLTKNAFIYGTTFTRESTRIQQQSNLNKAIRQMEGEINLQTNSLLQNATDTTSAGALQAQIAGQRLFIQKLGSLTASGRVSLDLDPAEPSLPKITLENGDTINIPHKPSFVSSFGAVLAETSFVHKDGMTVSDLVNKAGVTRSADIDSIFLIRADGSIEVNNASRSMWSFNNSFMKRKLNAGDTVFVPDMLDRREAYSKFIQGAKDWTQIIYQFGLGVAAFKVLRN